MSFYIFLLTLRMLCNFIPIFYLLFILPLYIYDIITTNLSENVCVSVCLHVFHACVYTCGFS